MLVIQLVEQQKIKLTDKIADPLTEIGLKTGVTVKELLNQTSGIQDYTEVELNCDAIKQIPVDAHKFAKGFVALALSLNQEPSFPTAIQIIIYWIY